VRLHASSNPIFNYYKSRLFFYFSTYFQSISCKPFSFRLALHHYYVFSFPFFFWSTAYGPSTQALYLVSLSCLGPILLSLSLISPYLSSLVSSISLLRSVVYSAHMYNLPPIELIYVTMDHSISAISRQSLTVVSLPFAPYFQFIVVHKKV